MITRIQPAVVPRSEAPFSQVVLDDRYAYLAGLVAADFPSGLEVVGDTRQETTAIMTTVSSILNELGLTFADIVRVEVHLSDLGDFDAMDSAYRLFFDEAEYPARTTTESPRLFGGCKVEITIQARLRT